MAVIDFRVRPPFEGFLKTVMYQDPERRNRFTRQLGLEPSRAAIEQSVDLMIAEMDAAGVDIGVVVGRNSGFFGSVDNKTVLDFVRRHPGRFVAVASIDAANRKDAIAEIEWASGAGFKAINIEPGAYAVPIHTDDRRLYPIYAHCEDRAIPVIIMNGGNAGPDLSYSKPEALDRVLADFPALKVAVSHGGWPWVSEILHIAYRRQNLFVSPDMYLVDMPGMQDYIDAANGFLRDRFIYGTSFPLCPIKGYRDWFERLPLTFEARTAALQDNAARFLGL